MRWHHNCAISRHLLAGIIKFHIRLWIPRDTDAIRNEYNWEMFCCLPRGELPLRGQSQKFSYLLCLANMEIKNILSCLLSAANILSRFRKYCKFPGLEQMNAMRSFKDNNMHRLCSKSKHYLISIAWNELCSGYFQSIFLASKSIYYRGRAS